MPLILCKRHFYLTFKKDKNLNFERAKNKFYALDYDCTYLNYRDTNSFSNLVYDYAEGKENLKSFYAFEVDKKGIAAAISEREKTIIDRSSLVRVLEKQYKNLAHTKAVQGNIESLLEPNTFTICTAHQPNLLTGYLYFFYKILHAIKTADELNATYSNYHFVPIYYMGSEDNDLEELGQFRYNEKKYTWDADGQSGAVGRMKTESLAPLLATLFSRLDISSKYLIEFKELIEESYLKQDNIADATQYLVNKLFGKYGLIVLNPDEAVLKKTFAAVMHDDLFEHSALPIVQRQSTLLSAEYKAQAFPRAINLFYLKDDIRERIERKEDKWIVLNTSISFDSEELENELANYPERFSPNVILRGLFQESILPNICFVGGGSEVAYWFQLKPLFEHYKVFFPMLLLRQSVQILQLQTLQNLSLFGLNIADIFEPEEVILKNRIIEKQGAKWDLENEKKEIHFVFESLLKKAKSADPTLEKSALSALAKMQKQLAILEQKIYRAEKRKEQDLFNKVKRIKAEIAPYGGLQERTENFISYYLQDAFCLFEIIKEKIKPFESQFLIVHPKAK